MGLFVTKLTQRCRNSSNSSENCRGDDEVQDGVSFDSVNSSMGTLAIPNEMNRTSSSNNGVEPETDPNLLPGQLLSLKSNEIFQIPAPNFSNKDKSLLKQLHTQLARARKENR